MQLMFIFLFAPTTKTATKSTATAAAATTTIASSNAIATIDYVIMYNSTIKINSNHSCSSSNCM